MYRLTHRMSALPLLAALVVLAGAPDPGGYVDAKWGTPVDEIWLLYPDAKEEAGNLFVRRSIADREATVRLGITRGKLSSVQVVFAKGFPDGPELFAEAKALFRTLLARYGLPSRRSTDADWKTSRKLESSWSWPTTSLTLDTVLIENRTRFRITYARRP